jgi:hypothetical protein
LLLALGFSGIAYALTPVIHISTSPSPAHPNEAVTLIATFDTVGGFTPTGQVQFVIDNSSYGGQVTISGGTASIADPTGFQPGTHSVGVSYAGDPHFATQAYPTNQITFTFNSIAVTSSSGSSLVSGQPTTLTATITGGTNVTGTVSFYDNSVLLGSPVSVGSGNQATFGPYSGFLHSGSPHSITAEYGPNVA